MSMPLYEGKLVDPWEDKKNPISTAAQLLYEKIIEVKEGKADMELNEHGNLFISCSADDDCWISVLSDGRITFGVPGA